MICILEVDDFTPKTKYEVPLSARLKERNVREDQMRRIQ